MSCRPPPCCIASAAERSDVEDSSTGLISRRVHKLPARSQVGIVRLTHAEIRDQARFIASEDSLEVMLNVGFGSGNAPDSNFVDDSLEWREVCGRLHGRANAK